jgi:hypothetical protein
MDAPVAPVAPAPALAPVAPFPDVAELRRNAGAQIGASLNFSPLENGAKYKLNALLLQANEHLPPGSRIQGNFSNLQKYRMLVEFAEGRR